jgi:hypothetical protein
VASLAVDASGRQDAGKRRWVAHDRAFRTIANACDHDDVVRLGVAHRAFLVATRDVATERQAEHPRAVVDGPGDAGSANCGFLTILSAGGHWQDFGAGRDTQRTFSPVTVRGDQAGHPVP